MWLLMPPLTGPSLLCEVHLQLAEKLCKTTNMSKKTPGPSKFIQDSSPLSNKVGMTRTKHGAKQHGRASSTCGIHPPSKEYCMGLRNHVWYVRSKVCASVCALARKANPS
jgi:hypothetical protein